MLKAGLLANPKAGKSETIPQVVKEVVDAFPQIRFFVPEGFFGVPEVASCRKIPILQSACDSESMEIVLEEFASCGCDFVFAAGGDGFLNRIATILLRKQIDLALMGIGIGTTNVGILAQFKPNYSVSSDGCIRTTPKNCFAKADLSACLRISPLAIDKRGDFMGYSFHDIVLGNTFLGTFQGKAVHFSAREFLENGELVQEPPKLLTFDTNLQVSRNRELQKIRLRSIGQIVISPLFSTSFYNGKAVTGLLCFSPFYKENFCMILSEQIIVQLQNLFPIESCVFEHFLFQSTDAVVVDGISAEHFVITDGNPLVRADGEITIVKEKRFVRVIRNLEDEPCSENF